jgi:hypothetical protein
MRNWMPSLYPGGRSGRTPFSRSAAARRFERFPDLVVEGCGGHLVLFRPGNILEPAAFPRFQDEVRRLARLFPGEMQIP